MSLPRLVLSCIVTGLLLAVPARAADAGKPNVIVILADDIGYGDLGCYGATKVKTPNLDRLAAQGCRFTDGHSSSSTCTPSRYAMLTGQYAWRKRGTNILPGDANLIIPPGAVTLPSIMKSAGYTTGVVGKWHLGLGNRQPIDWNRDVKPGPNEIGFDYSFLIPATGDRVPCVYVEDHKVVGLDPADPITVSYKNKVGDEPTGKDHPEMLKQKLDHGHDATIVNGISRIGWMSGGQAARWVDEDIADTITAKAVSFVERNRDKPFFLYFATHDIHVPRVPHRRFVGTSGCGVRGDAVQQLDWTVGEVMKTLDRLGLADNTLVIFSSDNGPVLNDGYLDGSVKNLNAHTPAGVLRGTKYSLYEGGHRVPLIARWPAKIRAGGTSGELVSLVDLPATCAALTGQALAADAAPDSQDVSAALLGAGPGRTELVVHAGDLGIRKGNWKWIPVPPGAKKGQPGQLFDLMSDLGETKSVADEHPEVVKELDARLNAIRDAGHSR